jgi:hypothetical protein
MLCSESRDASESRHEAGGVVGPRRQEKRLMGLDSRTHRRRLVEAVRLSSGVRRFVRVACVSLPFAAVNNDLGGGNGGLVFHPYIHPRVKNDPEM